MHKIVMIVLAALAVVLYVSPETLLFDPQNDLLRRIKDNAKMIALACAVGAGYLFYTSKQTKYSLPSSSVELSTAPASDIPTYEQSVSS